MSLLHVVLWKWSQPNARETYTALHVNVMASMLARHLSGMRYRIVCVTDEPYGVTPETFPLWNDHDDLANATKWDLPSCYRRLKLYDPATQAAMGIKPGDRIMGIDLDTLVTGDLKPLLAAAAPFRFMGWALQGKHHPKVFNGSLQIFTAGDLSEIWTEFDAKTSPALAFKNKWLGSDQSWLSMNLVGKPGCDGLAYPTVASYPHHIRQLKILRKDVRLIFFHGSRKPWHPITMQESPWVKRYWH